MCQKSSYSFSSIAADPFARERLVWPGLPVRGGPPSPTAAAFVLRGGGLGPLGSLSPNWERKDILQEDSWDVARRVVLADHECACNFLLRALQKGALGLSTANALRGLPDHLREGMRVCPCLPILVLRVVGVVVAAGSVVPPIHDFKNKPVFVVVFLH